MTGLEVGGGVDSGVEDGCLGIEDVKEDWEAVKRMMEGVMGRLIRWGVAGVRKHRKRVEFSLKEND